MHLDTMLDDRALTAMDLTRQDVLDALGILDQAGMPNDPDDDPVFSELTLDATWVPKHTGALLALVNDTIKNAGRALPYDPTTRAAVRTVTNAVRAGTMGARSPLEARRSLLGWLGLALPYDDD